MKSLGEVTLVLATAVTAFTRSPAPSTLSFPSNASPNLLKYSCLILTDVLEFLIPFAKKEDAALESTGLSCSHAAKHYKEEGKYKSCRRK